MKKILILLSIFYLITFSVLGQENRLYCEVQEAKKTNIFFENIVLTEVSADAEVMENFIYPNEVSFFDNISIVKKNDNIKAMNLMLPLNNKNITLELIEVPEDFYDYTLMTGEGEQISASENIKHYRGSVKGENNSLVAITFFKDEIMGLICTDEGNFNIVKDKQSGKHLVYNEQNLNIEANPICATEDKHSFPYDHDILFRPRNLLCDEGREILTPINKKVRFYVETRVQIYRKLGRDLEAVEAWVTALFNQVAVLYLNEDISIGVSCICMWHGGDPYTNDANAEILLQEFQSNNSSIPGDLGILLGYYNDPTNGEGIAAGFNGLCNSSTSEKLAVARINTFYNTVPVYSRSVKIITHELGHLLGSRHTHACVWNGNNTAIDGCAGFVEGNCTLPGNPSEGGTIMSYCDKQGRPGVVFNLGFGPQPGNVIRNSVINATCLQCLTPENITNQTITTNKTFVGCETLNFQNVTITNNATVNILAEENVRLKSNFHATAGTNVHITIASYPFPSPPNPMLSNSDTFQEDADHQNFIENRTDFANNSHNFKLYPNPNNGTFQIETNFPISEIVKFKVVNLLGVSIYENLNVISNTIQLQTPATGTVFVIMMLKNGTMLREKMVIQK